MINRLKQALIYRKKEYTKSTMRFINERKGWKTNRKIVVIESDDWGSIRMPNRDVYNKMVNAGLRVDKGFANKFDTLASIDDFTQLYRVLRKHKDKNGNHPVITANTIVANPDFNKIRENNFSEYYWEPFTDTLLRYPNHSFDCWNEGIQDKLFYPQFHGREHLNVNRWMTYLRSKSKEVHFAFDNKFFGIGSDISLEGNPSFVKAFNSNEYELNHSLNTIISEGLNLFEKIFGYQSKSFIAPNYNWGDEVERILSEKGVDFIQGEIIQRLPLYAGNKYNFMGKTNGNQQIYLTRNVFFEPSSPSKNDWVSSSLEEMSRAFQLKKPAIVCSHRVNFIGGIFESNRTNSLASLDKLLCEVEKKWPDVEFMNSVELGNLIKNVKE